MVAYLISPLGSFPSTSGRVLIYNIGCQCIHPPISMLPHDAEGIVTSHEVEYSLNKVLEILVTCHLE